MLFTLVTTLAREVSLPCTMLGPDGFVRFAMLYSSAGSMNEPSGLM